MSLDRALGDEQATGDRGVRESFRDELQNLPFAGGQLGDRVTLASAGKQPRDDRGVDNRLPEREPTQTIDEHARLDDSILEQISRAMRVLLEQAKRKRRIQVLRDDEHAHFGVQLVDPAGRDDAFVGVRRWHPDVDHCTIGLVQSDAPHEPLQVDRLGEHFDTGVGENLHDPAPGQHHVFGDNNAHRSSLTRRAALLLVAVACTAALAGSGQSRASAPAKGGTYRVGWEYSFEDDGFDPTGEDQLGTAGIYDNLLLRTLVGTNHVAGAAGERLVPDLATDIPAPTNGGRTYTFTLRKGVRFGPPVRRTVTSYDIRYAIERLARPRNGSWFWVYFDVIAGLNEYRNGHASSISGIATPNARTISFTLSRPDGAFPAMLSLPAAAPIPREVARCFEGKPGRYGFDLVSSGPYMIEGAGRVKTGNCGEVKPMVGISATQLVLVRNPDYDPGTDSPAARENYPDRFEFVAYQHLGLAHNQQAIVSQLQTGDLDDAYFQSTPKAVVAAAAQAAKNGRLRLDPASWDVAVVLNLTRPPFDDVHVRRAFAWLLDRSALRNTMGGPLAGRVATHIVPSYLLGGRLQNYDPFATPGEHGSVGKARAELALSKYATRHGRCIARVCKNVVLNPLGNSAFYAAGLRMVPLLEQMGARLGITFKSREKDASRLSEPRFLDGVGLVPNYDWPDDFPDPASFIDRSFSGTQINSFNFDVSLLGLTAAKAKRLGITGAVRKVPSLDKAIAGCDAAPTDTRLGCYATLDETLTSRIVAWIPLLARNRVTILGPQVAHWAFDQSDGTTAFAHVAVKQ